MGLFTNNKKRCPICNNPTPRIFATSVEGMPICKECKRKVYLPDGMLKEMSLTDFGQYMDFYNENKALRDIFTESVRLAPSYASDNLLLDLSNGLFRLKDEENSLVFEASALVSFRILEDDALLFESAGDALKCYKSDIPEYVKSMSAQISELAVKLQVQEEMERLERERQRERERNGETTTQSAYYSAPDIKLPVPLEHFCVELTMNHPYWESFRGELKGPRFERSSPSVDEYLRDYAISVDKLHTIAAGLMQMISPGAGEIRDGAGTEDSAADVIDEIKRYKALMDSGIISEEEFAAKKRQLLGI